MIKKVVIAAAGQGARMKHLTKDKSKHLIEVQERPFLAYLVDNLVKAGYCEIILVVGFRADKIQKFVDSYKPPEGCGEKYQVTLVNQYDILGPKDKEYGTLCPIKCVEDIVGKENFLAVYGDNIYSVRDLAAMNIDDDYCYLGARVEPDHPEKYGVLFVKDGFLEKIVEKPTEYIGNLVNIGLYKFTPEVFKQIPKVELSPRGEYELTDAVTFLAKEKKVKVMPIKDYSMDFGRPDDVMKFSQLLQKIKQ